MKLDTHQLELLAYKLIRREVRDFQRKTTDSELANYVRGVVNFQTELFDWSDELVVENKED